MESTSRIRNINALGVAREVKRSLSKNNKPFHDSRSPLTYGSFLYGVEAVRSFPLGVLETRSKSSL